jgi:hypothetical protein
VVSRIGNQIDHIRSRTKNFKAGDSDMMSQSDGTMLESNGVQSARRARLAFRLPSSTTFAIKTLLSVIACSGIAVAQQALTMQDRSHDNDSPDTSLYADYELFDTGTTTVPLSSVTFRYWFVNSNPGDPLVFSCDYAAVGCANITSTFVSLATPVAGADTYAQIGFTSAAGSLSAAANTGEIQTRVHNVDYAFQFGANDYSFITNEDFVYANTTTITVYINGVLVWGVEPTGTPSSGGGSSAGGGTSSGGGATPTTSLQVQDRSHDNDSPDETLYADYELFNTGTTPIPLSSVTFRYWFVNSNPGVPLVFNCDYASVGSTNITSTFVGLAQPLNMADTYVQIGFGSAAGSLGASQNTGEIQTRVNSANFAPQVGADDYSFISDESFVYKPSTTVTAYINGVLVWGVEPKP